MADKRAALICMGQSYGHKYADIRRAAPGVEIEISGILDGMSLEDMGHEVFPHGDEAFIVSNLADGREVRIAERSAISLTNACIEKLSKEGCNAALILCTGHFNPPETETTVLVPERLIPALLRALGVKRLGAIVPEPEQIEDSVANYAEFDPVIRASSPYGTLEALAKTAALFKAERVDMILADCMGFSREMGEIIAAHSGKRVFVPRVVLPALLGTLMI